MMKRFIAIFIFLSSSNLFAQVDSDDGASLLEAYFSPFGKSLAAGLNNGWFHTAKPHKLGGFDISLSLNAVIVPTVGKTFDITSINGFSASNSQTATFLGDKTGGTNGAYGTMIGNTNFQMPGGKDIDWIPIPMLQVGVGLIKGTEIDIRYVPSQKLESNSEIKLYGFGLKHDILQWLPMVDKIPVDLSIQAGYTNLNAGINVEDQGVNLNVKATTVNLIMSKKMLMFTGYLGFGYNSSTTTFDLKENISYTIGPSTNQLVLDSDQIVPLKFVSTNDFRTTLGFRLNITLLAIQANYTFAEYPVATVGIGITLR